MASVSAADIKKLREATGAGMTDCKNALVEADGDYDKAVEQLRIKGLKGVAKREGRAASNGLVIAKLDGTTKGTLLELNCETDFVAKSAKFTELAAARRRRRLRHQRRDRAAVGRGRRQAALRRPRTTPTPPWARRSRSAGSRPSRAPTSRSTCTAPTPTCRRSWACSSSSPGENAEVAKDVAQHIAAFAPTYVSRDEVPEDVVAKEREIAEATAKEEGKPEAALAEDRRGSRQRLLQGARAARAGLRQGQQEDRRQGARGGRRAAHRLRPLQGRAGLTQ